MKCEKCGKNEATVFYREVINGKESKYNLCSKCAEEKEQESGMFFNGMFGADLLGGLFTQPQSIGSAEMLQKCPLCGADFGFLADNGKVGCPMCYSTFESELEPTLKRLHGTAVHRGRVPGKLSKKLSDKRETEQLEKKLKTAISNEEYEKAAEYRDKLRDLRNRGAE